MNKATKETSCGNLMTDYTRKDLEEKLRKARHELTEVKKGIGDSGDDSSGWHDSANFDFTHRQTEFFTAQVALIEQQLKDPIIIKPRQKANDIAIGNTVTVKFQDEENEEVFTLLGPNDADRMPGWISVNSPLGSRLLGRKPGDIVDYELQERKFELRILRVQPGNFDKA